MRDDDFFIPKPAVTELREALTRTIPSLVEDLAVTTTRQDRITRGRLHNGRRGKPESRPPMNFDSAGAAQELHNALVGGVRLTCEARALDWAPLDSVPWNFIGPLPLGWRRLPEGYTPTLLDLSGWLRKYLISLALTEGAEDVHHEVMGAVKAAMRAVDLPTEQDIVIDQARVKAANRQVVTADTAEKIAGRLGALGAGLTAARVRSLRKHGHLTPVNPAAASEMLFYRLGDVLDAHHRVASRSRSTA